MIFPVSNVRMFFFIVISILCPHRGSDMMNQFYHDLSSFKKKKIQYDSSMNKIYIIRSKHKLRNMNEAFFEYFKQ